MKSIALLTAVAALAAAALLTPLSDATAQTTSTRELEGTVVSVDRGARTFRLRDHDGRGTATIKVTSRTRFERVSFGSLRAGDRNIEATVRRSNGAWVALEVERSGRDDDDRGGSGRGRDHDED